MLNDLYVWLGLASALVVVLIARSGRAGVLTLGYFLALSISSVPGILAYVGPIPYNLFPEETKLGFEVTLAAMAAYVLGATVARLTGRSAGIRPEQVRHVDLGKVGWRLLAIGVCSYFVALPLSAFVPSASAVVYAFGALLIPAVWLRFYNAISERSTKMMVQTLALLPLLPLSTLVTGGFLGYGVIWAVSVLSFVFMHAKRRWIFYAAGVPAVFLGLSLFVTYMQQRSELRGFIAETPSLVSRLEKTSSLVTGFEFLNLANPEHQWALAARLNQNFLAGFAVQRHEAGILPLYYGATIPLWVLIPRAIWPDKPDVGGSGNLASEVSGLEFAQGTSVGIGQVAELYVNFGFDGLLLGMFGWGFLLMRLDQAIWQALLRRDIRALVACALPGLAMGQPIGSLMEILVAVASGFIASKVLNHTGLLDQLSETRQKPRLRAETRVS